MYFSYEQNEKDEKWEMNIQSSVSPLALYIKMGEDANPTEFSNDISFKNILPGQNLTLTDKLFPKGS